MTRSFILYKFLLMNIALIFNFMTLFTQMCSIVDVVYQRFIISLYQTLTAFSLKKLCLSLLVFLIKTSRLSAQLHGQQEKEI